LKPVGLQSWQGAEGALKLFDCEVSRVYSRQLPCHALDGQSLHRRFLVIIKTPSPPCIGQCQVVGTGVTTIHIPRRPRVGSHGRHVEEPPRPQGIIIEFGDFLGVHGCECPGDEQVRFSNGWMTLPNLRGEVIRDEALGGWACTRSSTARRLGYAGTTSSCNVPRLCSEPQRRRLMALHALAWL
jgi:hypothetical protein